MWDLIHTEYEGPVGYSVTIAVYFAVMAALFVLVAYVVIPVAKSVNGNRAEIAVTRLAA